MYEAEKMLRRDSIQKLFEGYYFDNVQRIGDQAEKSTNRIIKRQKFNLIE